MDGASGFIARVLSPVRGDIPARLTGSRNQSVTHIELGGLLTVDVRRTGVALPGDVLESCRAPTRDLDGSASTKEIAVAVIASLKMAKTSRAVGTDA